MFDPTVSGSGEKLPDTTSGLSVVFSAYCDIVGDGILEDRLNDELVSRYAQHQADLNYLKST